MIFALVVALVAAMVTASADLSSLLSLDSERVLSGELWRIFSGHATHLTWRQYLLDAPAFVLLFTVYARNEGYVPAIALALCASVAVSVTVVAAGAHEVYGGLSGLSCAAFAAILMTMLVRRQRWVPAVIAGAAFCACLCIPGIGGSGVPVAGEAHGAGAVAGALFALVLMYRQCRCPQPGVGSPVTGSESPLGP